MGVQNIKRRIHMQEWREQVQQCKDSGMAVNTWCEANGIKKSTYYNHQRAVAEALGSEVDVSLGPRLKAAVSDGATAFVEYKLPEQNIRAAITLHLNCCTLEIHNSAEAEVIENTIRVLKRLC